MEEFGDNVIEVDVLSQMKEVGDKKPCKTCGNKGLGKNNLTILVLGFSIVFTSCYGIVKIAQDIYHLFAR
jgi:hypothetical protein